MSQERWRQITVGYGDLTPVTFEGRLIAAGLMMGGIALIGTVTATVASWIVEMVNVEGSDSETRVRERADRLEHKLDLVLQELDRLGAGGAVPATSADQLPAPPTPDLSPAHRVERPDATTRSA